MKRIAAMIALLLTVFLLQSCGIGEDAPTDQQNTPAEQTQTGVGTGSSIEIDAGSKNAASFPQNILRILSENGAASDFSNVEGLNIYSLSAEIPCLVFMFDSRQEVMIPVSDVGITYDILTQRLDELKDVPLTAIYVEGFAGEDLAWAANFPQLRELNLACGNATRGTVDDLSPLIQCPLLKRLTITNGSLSDIFPLVKLEYLSELNLPNNFISDIGPLSSFPAIHTVCFAANQIVDAEVFAADSLKYKTIDLSGNMIVDTAPFAGCFDCTQLDLSNNKITDGTPITKLFSEVMRTRDARYSLSTNPIDTIGALPKLIESDNWHTYNERQVFEPCFWLDGTKYEKQSIQLSYPD